MKKNYFIVVDTESTQTNLVADFAAVICDKHGKIYSQCAVLLDGIFNNPTEHPLFFDPSAPSTGLWSNASKDRRYASYKRMVEGGSRMIATVAAINRWLDKAASQYNPVLTAYNLPFDVDKCSKTGIDLTSFDRSFCLWSAAYTQFAHTKGFRDMVLDSHAFNTPTDKGNMTFKTNAETMARFVLGNAALEDEPHTALEDVIFYEIPILKAVAKRMSVKKMLTETKPYNWRSCQVKDWFKPA